LNAVVLGVENAAHNPSGAGRPDAVVEFLKVV
jgi:hypothetical protein